MFFFFFGLFHLPVCRLAGLPHEPTACIPSPALLLFMRPPTLGSLAVSTSRPYQGPVASCDVSPIEMRKYGTGIAPYKSALEANNLFLLV
jgi:hypothetical protein